MKTYPGYKALPHPLPASVVAVGNFDGVHCGHREILTRLKQRARALGVASVVYTFRPHPVRVLAPHAAPRLIQTYDQKRQSFEQLGIDIEIEEPFTRAYAGLSAEQFVSEVLHEALHTCEIFVGRDFSFGRGGAGDIHALERLGRPYHIIVHSIEAISFGGVRASSTQIRELISSGQIEQANQMLGRMFVLSGQVEEGHQRGRILGFPTANLRPEQELLPARGVYACWARIEDNAEALPAVVNVGIRPTFNDGPDASIEAHLLDFSGDIYGCRLSLQLVRRLREERTFGSVDALRRQIQIDTQRAREALSQTIASGDTSFESSCSSLLS